MQTELLIERLSAEITPVSPFALPARAAAGMFGGALFSTLLLVFVIGVQPHLADGVSSAAFWMKASFSALLAVAAVAATLHLARPEARGAGRLWPIVFPVGALASLGLFDLLRTPPALWPSLWLGASWSVCPLRILLLSAPVFIGLLWSLRRLAPTDLRSAGMTAGVASGAVGALLYCFRCPETSPIFVLTWYSLGILAAGAIGAAVGPRLLRW